MQNLGKSPRFHISSASISIMRPKPNCFKLVLLIGSNADNGTASLRFTGPDDLSGALLDTLVASCTLVVVDGSKEAVNLDSSCLADLLAEVTADTTNVAVGTGNGTLIYGHTSDPVLGVEGYQLDNALGADVYANAATLALFVVNESNAVFNYDGVKGTFSRTGTKTDTAVGTESATATQLHSGATVGNPLIIVFLLGHVVSTAAHYLCTHLDGLSCLNSHDSGDLFSHLSTADGTRVGLSLAVSNSLSKCGTSGEAASAAVSTGKHLSDQLSLFVPRYSKYLGSNSQHRTDGTAENSKYHDGKYNIIPFHIGSILSFRSVSVRYQPMDIPENPRNAIAIRPAVTSAKGIPLKHLGGSAARRRTRTPAKTTIAMVKPIAAAKP